MSKTSIYLNFKRETEEAFNFYKSVFGTEFIGELSRMGSAPIDPNQPPLGDEDKNLIMNVQLPILGGIVLMGTDVPESTGFVLNQGNNVIINLEPDTKEETEMLFELLSAGGVVETPLQIMFWGDFFGSCTDKFGTKWMFNCAIK
ncbi:VOC family protein [Candidatus Gracilibacteria bacterium]|nr:VOC family protein [Candidatus Gracilibacteria bacterium]NJS41113.1 VOC family protein [Candidatus Gracilibacteria bacterium]